MAQPLPADDMNAGLTTAESRAIWPGRIITLTRCPAAAIFQGLKRCENRTFQLANGKYDERGVPIGISVKKGEGRKKIIEYMTKNDVYKTQLLTNGPWTGMTPEEFCADTDIWEGKIIGYIVCDTVGRDPDWDYPHENYPEDRGFTWLIQQSFMFEQAVDGHKGGQSWNYITDPVVLKKYMDQIPV